MATFTDLKRLRVTWKWTWFLLSACAQLWLIVSVYIYVPGHALYVATCFLCGRLMGAELLKAMGWIR